MIAGLSLCTGYGGLDLAVEQVLGPVSWVFAETDKHASKVIAERFRGPNLGDVTTATDWPDADVITAGYPCQPFSFAGARKGSDDDRHLWPHVLRAVRMVRPGLVILENVSGHLSLGFDGVLADLASIGFDAEWVVVRASDVGAPHRRARLFVVAYPHNERLEKLKERHGQPGTRIEPSRWDDIDRLGVAAAHSHSERRQSGKGPQGPDGGGRSLERFGRYQPAIDRWAAILGRTAPDPLVGRQLNAQLVEWMMGLHEGWVTDLIPNRPALKVLGNGVVPQQAAHAIHGLLGR